MPREEGGVGVVDIQAICEAQVRNLQRNVEKIEVWKQKEVHGAHLHQLVQPFVDKAASNL